MTTYRKSVPKPQRGSGAAKAKKGLINIAFADDVLEFPERDVNGVKLLGNVVLKAGATMHQLYLSQNTQKITDEIVGDLDMEAFSKKGEGVHPGNSLDIREFRANVLGQDVILFFDENCGANAYDVLGSPCNPMRLKGSYANDNEGVKNIMQFEALVDDDKAIAYYDGAISLASNFEAADETLDLTKANGAIQQLPSYATTAAITVASTDLDAGTIVSVIGGGGADPATLSSGTQGAVDVILKDGTQWVALDKAVINLEVFKAGATTYLIERSRS